MYISLPIFVFSNYAVLTRLGQTFTCSFFPVQVVYVCIGKGNAVILSISTKLFSVTVRLTGMYVGLG